MDRFAVALFCDDVRDEAGNKISFMGVYGAEMQFSATPPVALPRLGLIVIATTPRTRPFQKFAIKLKWGSELTGTFNIPLNQLVHTPTDSERATMTVAANLPGIKFEKPNILYVEVETESETLEAGQLAIKFPDGPAKSSAAPAAHITSTTKS